MSAFIDWLAASQKFFQELGWVGVLAYAGLIVVVQIVLAPLLPVAIAGGFIFGVRGGFIAITLGTGAGAAINFLISRYLARGVVSRQIARNAKFQIIDAAIGREGWRIIALLRCCPIPFGFANYAYGLTAIAFWPYFLATIVAIIPGNLFFVWLGASAQEGLAAALGTGRVRHPFEYVMLGVGLTAAFFAMRSIGKIAKRALVGEQ